MSPLSPCHLCHPCLPVTLVTLFTLVTLVTLSPLSPCHPRLKFRNLQIIFQRLFRKTDFRSHARIYLKDDRTDPEILQLNLKNLWKIISTAVENEAAHNQQKKWKTVTLRHSLTLLTLSHLSPFSPLVIPVNVVTLSSCHLVTLFTPSHLVNIVTTSSLSPLSPCHP